MIGIRRWAQTLRAGGVRTAARRLTDTINYRADPIGLMRRSPVNLHAERGEEFTAIDAHLDIQAMEARPVGADVKRNLWAGTFGF